MSRGIDVSSYQGDINWLLAKNAGVKFAIIKVIRKDLNKDTKFEQNYSGCVGAGVAVAGVYNYSYATTAAKAVSDATAVINALAGKEKTVVWLDVEDPVMKNLGHGLVDIVNAYAKTILTAGHQFGIYTGLSFYDSYFKPYFSEISEYKFWIARYPEKRTFGINEIPSSGKPVIQNPLFGWQYTSSGSVPGVGKLCDLDEVDLDIFSSDNATPATPGHVQLNYHAGTGYCLAENMSVRSTPVAKADGSNIIKVNLKGTWALNVATMRDDKGWIWMYIGQDYNKGKLTDQWICADNGKKTYMEDHQV